MKVYIAMKRKLSIGDKMAGRHGNKGVIARIVPRRRYAVHAGRNSGGDRTQPAGRAFAYERGQILETHLGLGFKELGNSLKRLLSKEVKAEALRRWFREVFTETAVWKTLSKLRRRRAARVRRRLPRRNSIRHAGIRRRA